jgi:hypothetical protein
VARSSLPGRRLLALDAPTESGAEWSRHRKASIGGFSSHWVHGYQPERSLLSFSDLAILSAYFLESFMCFREGYRGPNSYDAPPVQRFNDIRPARQF